jgi:hypothetical protein
MKVRITIAITLHHSRIKTGSPTVRRLNMRSREHLTAHRVSQKKMSTDKNILSIATKSLGSEAYGAIFPASISRALYSVGIAAMYKEHCMMKADRATYIAMSSGAYGNRRIFTQRAIERSITKKVDRAIVIMRTFCFPS